jgi:hypothetical protein
MEMPIIGFPNGEPCGTFILVIVSRLGRLGRGHWQVPQRSHRIGYTLDIIEMVVSV